MTPLNKSVQRVCREPFFSYGPDAERLWVASLEPNDLLGIRPLRSTNRKVTVRLADVYRWVLMCQENAKRMEKLRAIKAKKAEARERRRLRRPL